MIEVKVEERSKAKAPPYRPIGKMDDPGKYIPDYDAKRAVEVAVMLGLPLLVTGDPGSGKTQLAHWLAHQYGTEPIAFHAKTTSTAQDLFYRYDALGHFHASNFRKDGAHPEVMEFIYPQALGLAILRALDPSHAKPFVTLKDDMHTEPRRSVVLIDEIDKAPRDFPNDVLDEIENMTFTVRETAQRVPGSPKDVDQQFRPIVILTSNSERNLPDAFLRRCAYLDIGRPKKPHLLDIVSNRLDLDPQFFSATKIGEAIDLFMKVREDVGMKKRPGTAELLMWLQAMNDRKLDAASIGPADHDAMFITCAILSKSREDEKRLKGFMGYTDPQGD